MEALYGKLYNKYTKLKKDKEYQFDKLNRDQEEKFLNFAAAADEMIEYLKSENGRLNDQVNGLKSELASIRSSNEEQQIHYQKLLMEENQKNKELTEEIARIQKLEQNGCSHCTTQEAVGYKQESSRQDALGEATPGKSVTKLIKKRKSVHAPEGTAATNIDAELDHPSDRHVYGEKGTGVPPSNQKPVCCQRKIYAPGGDATDASSVNCMFQYFVEFVVGMKVSPMTLSNELCILVHHQSSGYSFSLTWITNSKGEVEVLYRVLSLGTFERVAPDWMKETLVFSTSMCSVFFERVSRVIKS